MTKNDFPISYSGTQVKKAGEALINPATYKDDRALNKAFDVLSYWRLEHDKALYNAFVLLKSKALTIDKKAVVAKRLKRHASIVTKLEINKKKTDGSMSLSNMQDIAGCRAIVENEKKLRKLVRALKDCSDNFRADGEKVKYKDYIKTPKESGYRSYHIIGFFPGRSGVPRKVEIQVRTKLQHYWATSVEIVDIFTQQALKSNRGSEEWKKYFSSVGKFFSFLESLHLFESMNYEEQRTTLLSYFYNAIKYGREIKDLAKTIEDIERLQRKLNVENHLQLYARSLNVIDERLKDNPVGGYVLLIIKRESEGTFSLNSKIFPVQDSDIAEREYTEKEKENSDNPDVIIALVSTANMEGIGIGSAYQNFFADSSQFLQYVHFSDLLYREMNPSLLKRIFG